MMSYRGRKSAKEVSQPAPTTEEVNPDAIDAVFNRLCPVPDNLNDAVAREEVLKTIAKYTTDEDEPVRTSSSEQQQTGDVESPSPVPSTGPSDTVDPLVEIPVDSNNNADDDTLDKFCGTFDVNCCAKNLTGVSHDTTEANIEEINGVDGDGDIEKKDDPSLSELAARMNDIDVETAGGDSMDDNLQSDDYGHVLKSGKVKPWYHETFYATLIVLCSIFSIAIIVMAILLLTSK
jgi:hypothetical protein